jgi:hypothetical protein
MAPVERTNRPGIVARRFGYAVAVLVNLTVLYVLNIRPGWQTFSFLTSDTPHVLMLVNISMLAGIAANAVYFITDRSWVKPLGDLATTAIAIAVLIRIWQVFPFDFASAWVNWGLVVRAMLVVSIVGTSIGLVVYTVSLMRVALHQVGHPGDQALR